MSINTSDGQPEVPPPKSKKTDYYVQEPNDDSDKFEVYQSSIAKKTHLEYLPFVENTQSKEPYDFTDEWYPYVNSYYVHTECVDAFARVNEILAEKPSFCSIRSEDLPKVPKNDPYCDRDAQIRYLEASPVCFIILGKPDIGQEELGRHLSEFWGCVYISPEILIKEELHSGSRAGECIEYNLRSGRAVGIDVIIKLVEKRLKSETVKHRGYVLCGLPAIPNDLYEEDPVSSESAVFTVKDIFEEMIDTTFEIGVAAAQSNPHVSVSSKFKSEAESEDEKNTNKSEKHELLPIDVGPPETIVFSQKTVEENYEEQLNILFGLLSEPLIIIYERCGAVDAINKRDHYRYDIYSQCSIDCRSSAFTDFMSNEIYLNSPIIHPYNILNSFNFQMKHLVKVPLNFPANVATQIGKYYSNAVMHIEKRVLMHDPQFFIKIDGRYSLEQSFDLIKTRLSMLPLQKAIIPERLELNQNDENRTVIGEDVNQTNENVDTATQSLTTESAFQQLRRRQTPSNNYVWTWSDWKDKCPVSLRNGFLKIGDPNYAVHFMNRIFFLADEDCYISFIRNPRPYLLPPHPKSNCKIFIFGPPLSGKTSLSRCLAYFLNGEIVSPPDILERFKNQKVGEHMKKVQQAALQEALRLLNEERIAEANLLEQQRIEAIKEWVKKAISLIEELIELLNEVEREVGETSFEISSFPMAMKTQNILEIETESTIAVAKKKEEIDEMNIPSMGNNIEAWQTFLHDKKKLLQYLPPNLKLKIEPKKASIFDDFVKNYVDEAMKNAQGIDFDVNIKNVCDVFMETLQHIENNRIEQGFCGGGWIVDGMLNDIAIIKDLLKLYHPDEVIFLKDDSPNCSFLLNKAKAKVDTTFREFSEFFKDLGFEDAAFRSPSLVSTKSFKETLAKDVISQIFDEATKKDDRADTMRVDKFKKYLSMYKNTEQEVRKLFSQGDVNLIEISVTDKDIRDIMKEGIENIQKKYRMGASLYTEEDRAEEVKIFGEQESVQDEEIGEGTKIQKITDEMPDLDKIRKYGDTYNYCPVTLFENWTLWKGKEEYSAKYDNKVYLMSTEEYLTKFLDNPTKYIFTKHPTKFPPLRICVVGLPGIGKTTVSHAISENYGTSFVSYEDFLKKSHNIRNDLTLNQLRIENNAISQYLSSDQKLEEKSQSYIKDFWSIDPYLTNGIVFDDFPKRPSDVTFMVQNKLIPDIILELTTDEVALKNYIKDMCLNEWQNKVDKMREDWEESNKERLQEWVKNKRERYKELIEERREKRYAAKRNERADENNETDDDNDNLKASSLVSFDSVAEQEDVDEVTRIVDQEFPHLVFDAPQQKGDVTENFEALILDTIALEKEYIKIIKEMCEKESINFVQIPSNLENNEKSKIAAYLEVDKYKFRSKSLYERCYDVSLEAAERLISSGYFFLSKFGKTCPLQYYENKNPFQMYLHMKKKFNVFPVVHRSFIYFLVGKDNLNKFKSDPLNYINIPFNFPLISFKVAVIGPPKCGKRTLANRISEEYGLKFVSRGESCRHVLTYLPHSELSENMEIVLRKGWELTDDMTISSVEACSFDTVASTQGMVFCGFPNNINEIRHLCQRGMIPNLVIDLHANEKEIFECLADDKTERSHLKYSSAFIHHRYKEFQLDARDFRTWFDREYQITTRISIKNCTWSVWYRTQAFVESTFWEIKHYHRRIKEDWPLRLANMQVTPLEFLERQGSFKTFCPVCYKNSKAMNSGGDPPDRTGLIQFRKYFYWLCNEHIEIFLLFPEMYVQPYNNAPNMYPKKLSLKKMPENVYESGTCPVCYREKQAIRKGMLMLAIEYNQKVYLFDTQECYNKFWTNPQLFIFEISFRAPDKYSSLKYQDLPILGMLEQYVAKYIIKAISFVARKRAVIPGLNIIASAAVGMGIHLKVYNPNNREYVKYYKEGFRLYTERSLLLMTYLDNMKSVLNPYVHYEEPLPPFRMPLSRRTSTTESACTAVSKILYHLVDCIVEEYGNNK